MISILLVVLAALTLIYESVAEMSLIATLLLLGVILSDTNFGVSARHINMRRVITAADREVRLGFHIYPNVPLAELIDAGLHTDPNRRRSSAEPRSPLASSTRERLRSWSVTGQSSGPVLQSVEKCA